jgi:hypothetical protein
LSIFLRILSWLKLNGPRLFTLVMLVSGAFLLAYYLAASPNQIAAPKQGFGGAMSKAVQLDTLILTLDTQESPVRLSLQVFFHLKYIPVEERGPAYVMFVLPFRIKTVYVGGFVDKWVTVANSKPWVASIVYTQISNDSVTLNSTSRFGQFGVDTTFESSQRGIFTIVLPFESGVGGSDFPEVYDIESRLKVGFVTPPAQSIQVYVTLPPSAENVQAFPEPTSRSPYVRRPSNQTANSIYWVLSQRESVTVSYDDSIVRFRYDSMGILGSLFLGVGASGILDWLNGISRRERRFKEIE